MYRRAACLFLVSVLFAAHPAVGSENSPNILWITCEDTGPQLGCYGDGYAQTPNLDRLAGQGVRYLHCWSNAPVCAPARTTIISGVYPTSTGSEHMRSQVAMPGSMKMFPQFLREQGYYCTNNSKEDYNLEKPPGVWDESSPRAHWRNRRPGQPFFAVFNIVTTHESQIRKRPHTPVHDPAKVRVPAYHPDVPEVRRDWAQYYDKITEMDTEAGRRLEELNAAGLADSTLVFFYGDHGSGMPRSKRSACNSGLHVPLIIRIPPKFASLAPADYRPGGESSRLVSFVDLAPTMLSLSGIAPPNWMQGQAFLGKHAGSPRKYLFGFRGRMDERLDLVRSATDGRYVYVRNFMPHLPAGQHLAYMFETPTTQIWKRLYDEGRLSPPQTYFWEPKPPEELYDLVNDRDEVHNLAASAKHRQVLEDLRQALREHLLSTRDAGLMPEPEVHRRASGTTIYEFAQDPKKYPVERVLAAAELASTPGADPTALRKLFADDDPVVRYWGAMGLLIQGQAAVQSAADDLRKGLADSSPSVQLAAAWALGQYGPESDRAAMLGVLRERVSPRENGPYLPILALNVVDLLGNRAESLHEIIRAMPEKSPGAPGRINEYVPRLKRVILGDRPAPRPRNGSRPQGPQEERARVPPGRSLDTPRTRAGRSGARDAETCRGGPVTSDGG